jgi:hypothetical protein
MPSGAHLSAWLAGLYCGRVRHGLDDRKPDQVSVSLAELKKVAPGTQMRITLDDGRTIAGEYTGLARVPEGEYAARYANSLERTEADSSLPALGDRITVTLLSGTHFERLFLGFDCSYASAALDSQTQNGSSPRILLFLGVEPDTLRGMLSLSATKEIRDRQGKPVDLEKLQKTASEGKIPFLSAIALEDSAIQMLVPMEQVRKIEVPIRKNAKWTGLAIGAAADALWITAVIIWKLSWQGL